MQKLNYGPIGNRLRFLDRLYQVSLFFLFSSLFQMMNQFGKLTVWLSSQMKPNMMRNLLKKLINDLPTLEEYTTVPLKMLTLWYERCSKYYSSSSTTNVGMQASEEEKRLTMTLFTRIFDALARRVIRLRIDFEWPSLVWLDY